MTKSKEASKKKELPLPNQDQLLRNQSMSETNQISQNSEMNKRNNNTNNKSPRPLLAKSQLLLRDLRPTASLINLRMRRNTKLK